MYMTLYNTQARNPCAYCKKKRVYLTWPQVQGKKCQPKHCRHFVKKDHEIWKQKELKRQRKKEKKYIDQLMM